VREYDDRDDFRCGESAAGDHDARPGRRLGGSAPDLRPRDVEVGACENRTGAVAAERRANRDGGVRVDGERGDRVPTAERGELSRGGGRDRPVGAMFAVVSSSGSVMESSRANATISAAEAKPSVPTVRTS
jgi:hypothetical protein